MSLSSTNAFAGLEPDAQRHFTLHLYAAVLHLLRYLESLGDHAAKEWYREFPFLERYLEEAQHGLGVVSATATETLHRWRVELSAWTSARPELLPLRLLQTATGFTAEQVSTLLFAGLPEEDSRFGTVFSRLQEPLTFRLPTWEFCGRIFDASSSSGCGDGSSVCDQLTAAGLLRVVNPESCRTERLLKPPPAVWSVLRGQPVASGNGLQHHPPSEFARLEELVLDTATRGSAQNLPALLTSRQVGVVIVRGMEGSGRLEVFGTIARALGYGVILLRMDEAQAAAETVEELGALCLLTRSIPVLRYDLSPGQTVEPPALKGYCGPTAVLLGTEGGVGGPATEHSVSINLPPVRFAERHQHWRRHLNGYPIRDLKAIAERFHLPPGLIRRAARAAVADAQLNGGFPVTPAHVRRVCRELGHEKLNSLAERLDTSGDWRDLIVSPGTQKKLTELEHRCRNRERLLDQLGPAFRSTGPGVRALFTGASGTGKTLAAKLLSAVLEKDLYRLDLASVVNKYIGETEKNLHRVLSRAEELDVILLLDEGDALLGSRTEVRSANDRYANLETNYLLQRLENYQGIILVTTNVGELIDPAFRRRMDLVIEFLRPRRDERRRLWDLHLPDTHRIEDAFLQELALRCAFTGGQIRNAAAAASLLALRRGRNPLTGQHLFEAVRAECRKAGLVAPNLTFEGPPAGGMAGFRMR